ncbi:MAG: SGNH/GDSL hydrolase family protein [Bacteroidetes bacterium]|nr:MAG: SGNH/GDSL hydrolase family protein [Bacteroidota bacterium]
MKKLFFFCFVSVLVVSFTKRELTWVAIGDSITYLNDHQNETGNRISKGYMTRVTEKLSYIHFINQGHNGWTSGGIADQIEKLGLVKADVYSVFLGTNDWWQGRPLGAFADYQNNAGNGTVYGSFRIIINKLRSLNPAARIILVTPMQRTDFVYINGAKNNAYGCYKEKKGQTLEQFANAVDSIAHSEGFDVVDLYHKKGMDIRHLVKFKRLKDPTTGAYKNYRYPDYVDIPFDPDKDEYPYPVEAIDITYDGLHPSDKGYKIISEMLVKYMKKY